MFESDSAHAMSDSTIANTEILNIFDLDNIPSPFFLTALFSKLSKTAFDDSLF